MNNTWSSPRILIFANGRLPNPTAARSLTSSGDLVICADGGARHAQALGLAPHAVIGDLDSLEESEVAAYARAGVTLVRHSPEKDETDLELAVDFALGHHPASITVVAGLGGRVDHTLGNIALLCDERLADREVSLDDGVDRVVVCRRRTELIGRPGDVVSLIPWGGPVDGVRTEGLLWPLKDETLPAGGSRGLSNVLLRETAQVDVRSGLLLVIHRRLDPPGSSAK